MKIKIKLKILLLTGAILLGNLSVHSQYDKIHLSVSVEKNEINICDPIIINVLLENKNDSTIQTQRPNVYMGSLKLKLMHDQEECPQIQYDAVVNNLEFSLEAGETYEYKIELTKYYPLISESGKYLFSAIYYVDKERSQSVISNEVAFTVDILSEEDLAAQGDYYRFLYATILGKIKYGEEFLKNHPDCSYLKDVQRKMAHAYMLIENYEKAIEHYHATLASTCKVAEWSRNEVLWELAWTYHLNGEIENDISIMKKINKNSRTNKYIKTWEEELKNNEKD